MSGASFDCCNIKALGQNNASVDPLERELTKRALAIGSSVRSARLRLARAYEACACDWLERTKRALAIGLREGFVRTFARRRSALEGTWPRAFRPRGAGA
eukprot:1196354-Prorocentrum_minimum.AAC.1